VLRGVGVGVGVSADMVECGWVWVQVCGCGCGCGPSMLFHGRAERTHIYAYICVHTQVYYRFILLFLSAAGTYIRTRIYMHT